MQSTKHIMLLLYRRLGVVVSASGYTKTRFEKNLHAMEKFKWNSTQ